MILDAIISKSKKIKKLGKIKNLFNSEKILQKHNSDIILNINPKNKSNIRTNSPNSPNLLNSPTVLNFSSTVSDLKLKSKLNSAKIPINHNKSFKYQTPKMIKSKFIKLMRNNSEKLRTDFTRLKKINNISREMEKKFYIRNKFPLEKLEKSNTVIKASEKIVKKIIYDYKNFGDYNKEVLLNNKNSYIRNVEFIENQKKVKEALRLKDFEKFQKLKSSTGRKFRISSTVNLYPKNSDSFTHSLYSTPLYNTLIKKPSLFSLEKHNFKFNSKESELEQKVEQVLKEKKNFELKRMKLNSKKFVERIRNIDYYSKNYEIITKENSKNNVQRNILYNLGNLDRIIKLECSRDKGFENEDYEDNIVFLRKNTKDYNFFCDKALAGYYPNFVKKNKFKTKTLIKYGHLQGKFFGLPV
jgi:hypothetical protein